MTEKEDSSSTSSDNDEHLVTDGEMTQTKNMDDFLTTGRYLFIFIVAIEFMTLTTLTSMLSMVFIGAHPEIESCGNATFDEQDTSAICSGLPDLIRETGCEPKIKYQFASVNVEWKMYCEEAKDVKFSITVQMFGVLIGSAVFGHVSDMYGRRFTLIISMFFLSIASFANGLVSNFQWFLYLRIICGFFTGGLNTSMGVYMIENIPLKHRMWISAVITWSPNFIIFTIIAYLCAEWRSMMIASGVVCALSVVIVFFLFESPRFLIQKGRVAEARKVFQKIQKIDGTTQKYDPVELEEMLRHEQMLIEKKIHKSRHYHYYHIMCTWKMLAWTLTLSSGVAVTSLTNYSLLFSMEQLSGSLYWNNVYMGIIRWIFNIGVGLADYLFIWFGRRPINLFSTFFNAICLALVAGHYLTGDHSGGYILRWCTILVSSMCSQLYIAKFMACNELYPTSVRNLAVSMLLMFSRLGTLYAPQFMYLRETHMAIPYIILTVLVVADLLSFQIIVPETKGQKLMNHLPPKEERIFYRKPQAQSLLPAAV